MTLHTLSSSVSVCLIGLSSFHFQESRAKDPLSSASCFLVPSWFLQSNKLKPSSEQSYEMEVPHHQGHEAALRTAAQNKPLATARPWPRGGGGTSAAAPQPPPPKVYRVEPREFRDLVQRLTGAPPTALRRQQNQQHHPHQHRVPVVEPQPVRPGGQQQAYGVPAAAPWFSFPMAGGVEAAAQPQHGGAFL